jgi:membrane protease YdiL (CAAX protease family)
MGARLLEVVRRNPFVAFLVLTFVLSWWPWLLYAAELYPLPIFQPGPFLAALIVAGLTVGKAGRRDLLRRMVQWRAGAQWYLVALGLPAVLAGTAALVNIGLGATPHRPDGFTGWSSLAFAFALNLLVPIFGGAWEEPGWRGYAQRHLQQDRSALLAGLILGAIGVAWHLPLFLMGDILPPDIVLIFAGYVVYAWFYNSNGGSILLLMMIHAANNTFAGGIFSRMFSGADAMQQSWLLAGVWWVAAISIILVAGPAHLSHKTAPAITIAA